VGFGQTLHALNLSSSTMWRLHIYFSYSVRYHLCDCTGICKSLQSVINSEEQSVTHLNLLAYLLPAIYQRTFYLQSVIQ